MPMPKKSRNEITITDAPRSMTRTMAGGGDLVQVDAVFHVPAVHPVGSGPWSEEADKISWTDMPTGYGCIMRRSPLGKYLAGYVSVPPGHPMFGRGTGSLNDLLIGVHGGIDYAAACRASEPEEVSICHPSGREKRERVVSRSHRQTVYENEAAKGQGHADAWWFGFSCNQIGDVLPDASYDRQKKQERLIGGVEPIYRTEAYVYRECVRLAAQLKAIEEGRDPRDADPGPSASSHDPYRTRG